MNYEDEAIILKYRPFEEKKLIVNLLTKENGMVSGILSKNHKNILVPANIVWVNYYSKNKSNLGTVKLELVEALSAYLIHSSQKMTLLQIAITLLMTSILEGQIDIHIYKLTHDFLDKLRNKDEVIAEYFIFELNLLSLIGYGINLHECSVTGKKVKNTYVSPKTGLAVSKEIGEPYKDRLYLIPDFFFNPADLENINEQNLLNAYKLLEFYYSKFFHVELKKFLDARKKILQLIST